MSEDELKEILNKIEAELTGDPEHDAEILNDWGERYRSRLDSEPLLLEISRRLFDLYLQEEPDMPQMVFNDMVETADDDFAEACRLIEQQQYDEAATKLDVLTKVIEFYPLTKDAIWTDFTSYLETMLYQDFFSEQIGDTEIRRHPMHPGNILFTYGELLIEMGNPDEALKPLEMAVMLDPVSPKYLFELGEAYKRTGQLEEAFDTALWALDCATNNAELARCYRDMAFCLSEAQNYEDAVLLYLLSLRYQSSRQAEMEIAWIRKNFGITTDGFTEQKIQDRCKEVGIQVGLNEVVKRNIELLEILNRTDEDDEK